MTPATPRRSDTQGFPAHDAGAAGAAPAVSVLMAVHDSARYLREAVASVLGQTLGDFELVVVDDASSDDSPRILDECVDPRIVRIRNESNLGLAGSLNRGLERCRAPLIARMDADDICEPTRLAEQVDHLLRNPHIGVLGTWTTEIDDAGRETRTFEPCGEPAYIRWRTFHQNIVYHPTVMMRRESLAAVGGYDAGFRFAQDYDLFSRMILAGVEIAIMERRLLRYRRSPGAISSARREEQWRLASRVREHYNLGMLGESIISADAERAARLLSWGELRPGDADGGTASLVLRQRAAVWSDAPARARAAIDATLLEHLPRRAEALLGTDPAGSRRLARVMSRLGGGSRGMAARLWLRSWRVQFGAWRRRMLGRRRGLRSA